MALNEIKCKNAKPLNKAQKLSDEKGLYLEVAPSGSKYTKGHAGGYAIKNYQFATFKEEE